VHLVGFTIEIYYDTLSYKRQIKYAVSSYYVINVEFVIPTKALFTLMHK